MQHVAKAATITSGTVNVMHPLELMRQVMWQLAYSDNLSTFL